MDPSSSQSDGADLPTPGTIITPQLSGAGTPEPVETVQTPTPTPTPPQAPVPPKIVTRHSTPSAETAPAAPAPAPVPPSTPPKTAPAVPASAPKTDVPPPPAVPVVATAPVVPTQPAAPGVPPTPPKPAEAPKPSAPVPVAASSIQKVIEPSSSTKQSNLATPPTDTSKPYEQAIPVVPAPPLSKVVPAMKPVQEKLISRPHLETRPPELKLVTPLTVAQKDTSPTNQTPAQATIPQPLKSKKSFNIFERLPKTLIVALAIGLFMAILSLVEPLKTNSQITTYAFHVIAITIIVLTAGMLKRLNWVRSIYVIINVIALILTCFVIYQIRTDYNHNTKNASASAESVTKSVSGVSDWLDPTYHQGDTRIVMIIGQLAVIYMLTTPFMTKAFDKH